MTVPMRHVLEQGAMLRALGATALGALRKPGAARPATPGAWHEAEVRAPSPALVRAFVKQAGGDPASYRGHLPPSLFPQWALPLASRALAGVPYPMVRVVNAGVRLEMRAPLPAGEALEVKARLESIDENDSRALLTTRVVTGTRSAPDALIGEIRAFVPLQKGSGRGAPALVPDGARELAYTRLGADAGLDFAKLTGDFNPIHWIPSYARSAGFRGAILHGFGTLAIAMEAVVRRVLSGDALALHSVDARFTRPLVLPAKVGVYATAGGGLFVGDAPGSPAYLTGETT